MPRRSFALLALAVLLVTGCSKATQTMEAPMSAPAPVIAAVEPAGKWSVALVAQGQQFDFVLELTKTGEMTYSGSMASQAFPTMPFTGGTLAGNRLKFSVVAPTGDNATFDLVFEGDTFSGDWAMPGDGSKVSGRRIP